MKPLSKVIVEEGHLYTPEGKHKFEYLSYPDLQDIDPHYRGDYHARASKDSRHFGDIHRSPLTQGRAVRALVLMCDERQWQRGIMILVNSLAHENQASHSNHHQSE